MVTGDRVALARPRRGQANSPVVFHGGYTGREMPQLRSVPGLALGLVLGIGAQPLVLEVPSSGDRRALSSAGLVRSGSLLRGSNKGGIWESGADPRGPRPRGATSSAPRNAGPRSDLPPFPDEAGSIPQGGKNCAHANSELPGEEPGWRALARKGPPPRRTGEPPEPRSLRPWVGPVAPCASPQPPPERRCARSG